MTMRNCSTRISLIGVFASLLLTLSVTSTLQAVETSALPSSHKTYAYANGKWFDGETFQDTTFYFKAGHLTTFPPSVIDKVVDLQGGFVLPPFGEAHTHNVEGSWNIDHTIHTYLKHGIFYVKNPNNIGEFAEQIQAKLNTSHSIDVVFANGGLTSTEGHPVKLYEDILRLHRYAPFIGRKARGWFKDRGYFTIDTQQDLDMTWPRILSGKPDFIKIYIGHAPTSVTKQNSTVPRFRKGLNPDLIVPIVQRAHKNGLRVSAHVETAEDFREAVHSGVDEIAHTPGWYLPSQEHAKSTILSKHDAQLALHHHVTVVTTAVASLFHPPGHHQSHKPPHSHSSNQQSQADHPAEDVQQTQQLAQTILKDNLQLLHRHGVKLAIGSDHAETSLAEALHLHHLGVFDTLTLLKLWCETTAETIFPHRKIGKLKEGYEANFIVLAGNPIHDFQQVRHIQLRVKQGRPLIPDI